MQKILITLSRDCYKTEWLKNRAIANIESKNGIHNIDLKLVDKYGIVAAESESNEATESIKRIRGVEDVEPQQERSIYSESI